MSKWFKRKKYASKDYTADMLPSTRKALFFDGLKLNWKNFLGYGLIFLLFCLPTHIVSLLQSILIAQRTTGAELPPELQMEVLGIKNSMALAQIPGLLIISIGISAFSRIIRQYAWGENVFFGRDFLIGIKHNVKQMAFLGAFTGIVYYLSVDVGNMALVAQDAVAKIIYMLPVGTVVFLGIPMAAYAVVLISIYQNSFFRILQMAFALTVKKLFKNWLVVFCCLALLTAQFIPSFAVSVAVKFVYSVLAPVIFFLWYLYALEGIDKFINEYHYPEMVGKGLYQADKTGNSDTKQEDLL